MKNYWLNRKNRPARISADVFQEAAIAYMKNRTVDNYNKLYKMFESLTENILAAFGDKMDIGNREQAKLEGVYICFTKLSRFNPEKGKAFNFFTTIILGHLGQVYRRKINYEETRKYYEEFLARKKEG